MLVPLSQGGISLADVEGSDDVEGQGAFLMVCHKSTDEYAYLMGSNDGKSWNLLQPQHFFTPASGNQRDPDILFYSNQYWVAHTNASNTYWTLLSSPDLQTWTKIVDVDMTSIASLYHVWAPGFYNDGGTIRVFTSCSTGGVDTNFQIYEQHATASDLTTWSNPTILTGTSLRSNMIDPWVTKLADGYYYVWYKDDDTDYIEIMRSTSLTSGYVKWKTADWAGWGSGLEAPYVVKMSSTKWRAYLNQNSGLDSVAIYYSDSDSADWSTATWGTKTAISAPWTVAHPGIMRTLDFKVVRQMLFANLQASRTRGCGIQITTNKSIADSTTTALTWDSYLYGSDSYPIWNGSTKCTLLSTGFYLIQAHVHWSATATGLFIMDIRINGTSYLASVALGSSNQDNNTCLSYYLFEDDYIEVTVYQNSGGSRNVNAGQLTITRLF